MKTQVSGPKQSSKKHVANDAPADGVMHQPITQRAVHSAHETIDSAAIKADEIELSLRTGAATAGTKLEESQQAATEQIESSIAKLESFVKGRPVAAAGIAFIAGVLATSLFRR